MYSNYKLENWGRKNGNQVFFNWLYEMYCFLKTVRLTTFVIHFYFKYFYPQILFYSRTGFLCKKLLTVFSTIPYLSH